MPSKREWAMLALVLPVILLAVAAEHGSDDGTVAIAEVARADRTNVDVPRSADTGELDLARLRRRAPAAEPADAFAAKSWYVPPPPPQQAPAAAPTPLAPPTPQAPPLPFTYLGRFQDAAAPVIFLVRSDRVLAVRAGDVIEGTYRVDGIVGSALRLTYLPLNIKQTLDIGNAG